MKQKLFQPSFLICLDNFDKFSHDTISAYSFAHLNIEQSNSDRTITLQKWFHKKILDLIFQKKKIILNRIEVNFSFFRFKNICFFLEALIPRMGWKNSFTNQKILPILLRFSRMETRQIFWSNKAPFLIEIKINFFRLVIIYRRKIAWMSRESKNKNWKTVFLLLQRSSQRSPPSTTTSEPENRIEVWERISLEIRPWSCPIEDEQRCNDLRWCNDVWASLGLASDDDASFINPGHESEREREKERGKPWTWNSQGDLLCLAVIKFILK